MITFKQKGNFNNTEKFFKGAISPDYMRILEKYARQGVIALSQATPVDSGKTANSWGFEIQKTRKGVKIIWTNTNVVNGVPIAVLIEYGHATGNGGYVEGRDYINPVLQPIFDKIASELWEGVSKV
jgi:hypothetical protein